MAAKSRVFFICFIYTAKVPINGIKKPRLQAGCMGCVKGKSLLLVQRALYLVVGGLLYLLVSLAGS